MRVTLADVISLNGKITKGDDQNIHAWSSREDWEHFVRLRDGSDVVIIDNHTYKTVKPLPQVGMLRLVITDHPEQYAADRVSGQLEFLDVAPGVLIPRLAQEGYQRVLIAGGAALCSAFLAAHMVHDMYISFEPVLFGMGEPMLAQDALDISLQLLSVERLNEQGTLLAHYTIRDAR